MRKSLIEIFVILFVSLLAALIYNNFSPNRLPLFKKYKPAPEEKQNIKKELPNIEKIDIEIFKYLKERKNTIVLDARSKKSYERGHIPGAFSFPVSKFDNLYKERGAFLKNGKTIITYCSGKSCIDSLILALKLKHHGIKDILCYQGGISEWSEKGNRMNKVNR